MGIPFFSSLIYKYLIPSPDHFQPVNLTNQSVIIDGNSFMYFIYKEMVKEDSKKQKTQRSTGTPFGYDGCWKKFHDILSLFSENCSTVIVVFDGLSKPNPYRRDDPFRPNHSDFVDHEGQKRLPTLLRHEVMNILYELNISIIVAQGEADPVIVKMAREKNAYIVAYDSDYHLYQLSQGFVSLRYLDLKTLTGRNFQLADVFGRLSKEDVALWATLVGNTFFSFDELQEFCPKKFADKKNFDRWLKETNPDGDKHQWITTQLYLLRWIENVGETAVYDQLIKSISQNERFQFNEIMKSYINAEQDISISPWDSNSLPPFLEQCFIDGELDRKLIDVFINRELSAAWQNLSFMSFRLLLPICHIVLRWNYQNEGTTDFNPTITYKEQEYYPFEMFESEDLPLLDDVLMSENDQSDYVLYCIQFVHQSQVKFDWNNVNEDYILWLSILKLWFHGQGNTKSSVKPILFALIISYIKHVLLDTYDEEDRDESNEQLVSPLLQYPIQTLKNQFPLEVCVPLRKRIDQYSETILSNALIDSALYEVEQLYDSLTMIYQFFRYPLPMPPPHICINQLTYRLAVRFSTSKNISKDINLLFQDHQLLFDIFEEIQKFICDS